MKKDILLFIEIIALIIISISLAIFFDDIVKKNEQKSYEIVKKICEEKNREISEAYTKDGDKYYVCK